MKNKMIIKKYNVFKIRGKLRNKTINRILTTDN